MTKERWIVVVSIMMCILGCVCFWLVQKNIHKEQQTKTEEKSIYKTLSESDKKAADIYAELYEESAENVSRIYQKTNKQLEKQFFTIDENIKYQMQKEGYRLEDLEKAEKLSVQTGKKAMELIRAKGKASDNRKWSDVVKKEELQTAETTEVPE